MSFISSLFDIAKEKWGEVFGPLGDAIATTAAEFAAWLSLTPDIQA